MAHSSVGEQCVPGHEMKAPFPLGPGAQPGPGKSDLGSSELIQQVSVGCVQTGYSLS
jgi:hypothetical protein